MGQNFAFGKSRSGEMVSPVLANPPSFPPLAPSGEWFTHFLKEWLAGASIEEAILQTNRIRASAKDFSRLCLIDSNGELLKLSLTIEGGSRILRTIDHHPQFNREPPSIGDLKLSDHGNWRKNHLGAFESILGKKPFYRHLEPSLKVVYLNPRLDNLADFNSAIFGMLFAFLLRNVSPTQIREAMSNPNVLARGKELATQIDLETSLLQTLSELGPESLLGLIGNLADIL